MGRTRVCLFTRSIPWCSALPLRLPLDLTLARTLWMVLLELGLLGVLAGGLSLSRWRPSLWMGAVLLMFTFLWLPGLRPLLNGNLSILSALLLVTALLVMRSGQDPLAGFLLVLAALRGEALVLLIIFILIYSASVQRWTLFWSIVGSFFLLIAATSLLLPDWVPQYARRLVDLSKATLMITPGSLVSYWLPGIGRQVGWLLTILLAGMLVWEWRAALTQDFRWFLWTAYLTLAATVLIGIPSSQENYILLLPGFLLILATWQQRWGRLGWGLIAFSLLALSLGLWALALTGARRGTPPDLDSALFFIPPFLSLIGLYWVRWWAIRPHRLPVEALADTFRD